MSRGGKRKGAGRKKTSTKKPVTIRLEEATISLLHEKVGEGARTKFIENSIKRRLDKL